MLPESSPAQYALLTVGAHPLATRRHVATLRSAARISQLFAGTVIALTAVVIAGWVFKAPTLTRFSPHFATMKFNAALCFLLVALTFLMGDWLKGSLRQVILGGLVLGGGQWWWRNYR